MPSPRLRMFNLIWQDDPMVSLSFPFSMILLIAVIGYFAARRKAIAMVKGELAAATSLATSLWPDGIFHNFSTCHSDIIGLGLCGPDHGAKLCINL